MKTTVMKEGFRNGLQLAERAVSKSLSLPILGNVLLSAEKNWLEIAATDLEIGVRFRMLAKNEKEGAVVIPPRVLPQLLNLSSEEAVSLQAANGTLKVQTKDHAASLKTQGPEEFPLIPGPQEGDAAIELDATAFCEGLAQVAGMAGQSKTRPEMTGIFFSVEQGALRLAATDSFRLAERIIPLATKTPIEESVILPQKTARELIAVFGDKEGVISLVLSPTQAIFQHKGPENTGSELEIVTRLIEGEYPQYREVIPKETPTTVAVSKTEFLNRLRATALFASKTNEVRLAIHPEKNGVEFQARSADVGENVSFLSATVQGPKLETAFNWRFLAEGLAVMKTEQAEIRFTSEDGPALLVPSSSEPFQYVVMPIRG